MHSSPAQAHRWEQVSSTQYGILSRRQAVGCGLSHKQVDRMLARGSWIRVLPAVFRVAAAPEHWRQAFMAAFLWAEGRAVISGRSAAAHWELEGHWKDRVELSGCLDLSPPHGVAYRQVKGLLPADVTTRLGIRVTTPARTILDLAAVVPPRTLERTLDEMLRRELATLKGIFYCIDRNGRRTRKGVGRLEALLSERRQQLAPDSPLETDVAAMLREHGLPSPIRRYQVIEGDQLIAEVDLAWPKQKVAVQVHGSSFHRQLRTWENDQRVENLLQLAGWLVVKVTPRMIDQTPEEVMSLLSEALTSRLELSRTLRSTRRRREPSSAPAAGQP